MLAKPLYNYIMFLILPVYLLNESSGQKNNLPQEFRHGILLNYCNCDWSNKLLIVGFTNCQIYLGSVLFPDINLARGDSMLSHQNIVQGGILLNYCLHGIPISIHITSLGKSLKEPCYKSAYLSLIYKHAVEDFKKFKK